MTWGASRFLSFLPLVLAIWVVVSARRRAALQRFAAFAHEQMWRRIAPDYEPLAHAKRSRLRVWAIALVLLAAARPQLGVIEESVKVTGLDIVIALDVSNSMDAEDVVPSRLKAAKHFIRSLTDRLNGDRVGVIAFAASAAVVSPLTTDLDYVREVVDGLNTKSVFSQGTDVGLALEMAAKTLGQGAEQGQIPVGSVSQSDSSRVVLLISDGEDQEEAAAQGAEKIKANGAKLFVLGIGTERGGQIPVRDESGQLKGYKRDRAGGNAVITSFKPDALMGVAKAGQGKYWTITPGEAEIDELVGALGGLTRGENAERRITTRRERYVWPLTIAIVLLTLEMFVPMSRLTKKRKAIAAVFALATLGFPEAYAAGSPSLEVYRANERGIEALKEGRLDEARRHFGAAQARDPKRAELDFNQGLVMLEQGEAEGAAKAFDFAAKEVSEKDPVLAGRLDYNRGIAHEKEGKLADAAHAYQSAVERAKKSLDKETEDKARNNLELLHKKRQQQKQQQKQGEKKDDQSKEGGEQQQDQKSKPGDQDKKDDKEGESNPAKDQQQKQGKQDFRSLKMSKEDAERVMSELGSREQELRGKLKRQRGNPQPTQKDW